MFKLNSLFRKRKHMCLHPFHPFLFLQLESTFVCVCEGLSLYCQAIASQINCSLCGSCSKNRCARYKRVIDIWSSTNDENPESFFWNRSVSSAKVLYFCEAATIFLVRMPGYERMSFSRYHPSVGCFWAHITVWYHICNRELYGV